MSSFFPMLRSGSLFPEDSFLRSFFSDFPQKPNFAMDIRDEGDHFLLEADMPGFSKDHIKVNYKNNVLTIQAERSETKEDSKDDRYMVRERHASSVRRQIIVENIREEDITGSMEDGVLKIVLPKKTETALPEGRDIDIG